MSELKIGLALSGGGSRAIAFHLGCLRALHDRNILAKVRIISSVSGGSVIAALYAYKDQSFEDFERDVKNLLMRGLSRGILRYTFFSAETPKIIGTAMTSGLFAALAGIASLIVSGLALLGLSPSICRRLQSGLHAPLPRFASRTTAFSRYLDRSIFGSAVLSDVAKPGLDVVINAAELRTGTAFRYGSKESGSWRFGTLVAPVQVAKAVAASAAYPALLPALDEMQRYRKGGTTTAHRTIITDGGVYDNLGISCLLPGRDKAFSTNVGDVNFIISCVAGQGLPDASSVPYWWASRMVATVNTIHRRTHSMAFDLLHRLAQTQQIKGFLLPYLGQQDDKLPAPPPDLVPRQATFDYPTDFSPMSTEDISKISLRGEQLTRSLIETYHPDL